MEEKNNSSKQKSFGSGGRFKSDSLTKARPSDVESQTIVEISEPETQNPEEEDTSFIKSSTKDTSLKSPTEDSQLKFIEGETPLISSVQDENDNIQEVSDGDENYEILKDDDGLGALEFAEDRQGSEEDKDEKIVEDVKNEDQEQTKMRRRRKCNFKRILISSSFLLFLIIGGLFIGKWVLHYIDYGMPPSDHGYDASFSSIIGFLAFCILCPVGFFILTFRISNLFTGISFMFTVLLVMTLCVKGFARSIASTTTDTMGTSMRHYYKGYFRRHHEVPDFYTKMQTACSCCGFQNIDWIADWPTLLNHKDLPGSCCKPYDPNFENSRSQVSVSERQNEQCKGLGRTWNDMRLPSGFTMITFRDSINNWIANSQRLSKEKPKPPFIINANQVRLDNSIIKDHLKQYSKEFMDKYKKATLKPHNVVDEDGHLKVDILPLEFQVKFDVFVEELIYGGQMTRGEYIIFEIPLTSTHVIKANSAAKHVQNPNKKKRVKRSGVTNSTVKTTKTKIITKEVEVHDDLLLYSYYISKGVTENNLLDGVIWEHRCDRILNSTSLTKGFHSHVDLGLKCNTFSRSEEQVLFKSKDWKTYFSWRDALSGKHVPFFEGILKATMVWYSSLCTIVFFLSIIMAMIFWYFYSRLKKEELEDLVMPTTDFEQLDIPASATATLTEEEIAEIRRQKKRILKELQDRMRKDAKVARRRRQKEHAATAKRFRHHKTPVPSGRNRYNGASFLRSKSLKVEEQQQKNPGNKHVLWNSEQILNHLRGQRSASVKVHPHHHHNHMNK